MLFSIALLVFTAQAKPIVLPSQFGNGVATVEVDGAFFIIDTGSEFSIAKPSVVSNLLASPERNSLSEIFPPNLLLGVNQPLFDLKEPASRVDGIIGWDELVSCAIGFDYDNNTVSIWNGGIEHTAAVNWMRGSKSSNEVREIVTSGTPLMSGLPATPPLDLPVVFDSGGETLIMDGSKIGGSIELPPCWMGLIYGASVSRQWLIPKLTIGGITRYWRVVSMPVGGGLPFYTFTPEFLSSRRILIDLADNRLFFLSNDTEKQEECCWAEYGLSIRGDQFYLTTEVPGFPWSKITPVTRLAGVDLASLRSLVEHNDHGAAPLLAKIQAAILQRYEIVFKTPKGEVKLKRSSRRPPPTTSEVHVAKKLAKSFLSDPTRPRVTNTTGTIPLGVGLNVIPQGWDLLDVPNAWVKDGPRNTRFVTVPAKAKGKDRY